MPGGKPDCFRYIIRLSRIVDCFSDIIAMILSGLKSLGKSISRSKNCFGFKSEEGAALRKDSSANMARIRFIN